MNFKQTLLAIAAMVLSILASAETLSVRVTDHAESQEAGAFDSPELEAATLQWLGYMDRVIYSPNPIRLDLTDTPFTDGRIARTAIYYNTLNNQEREQAAGLSSDFFYPEPLLVALGAPYRDSSQDMDSAIQLSSVAVWNLVVDINHPTVLFDLLAHELVHGLGFSAGLRRDGSMGARHKFFSSFIFSSGERLVDMTTNEARSAVFYNEGNVVFSGEATNLYGAEILTFGGGVEGVQLQASAISDKASLSHFSKAIDPDLLMESGSLPDDYFVSFAVLSDMGYGDMLDTQVSVHSSANDSLVLVVKSETLQDRASIDSVVLTIPLVEGLTLTPSNTDITCDQTESALVCELPELATNMDHLFSFDVAALGGTYAMQVDVEHKNYHVDASPLNNFHDVVLFVSLISNLSISDAIITSNTSQGGEVGTLSADHVLGSELTFTLVDDIEDNARFGINGDKVITRESLTYSDNGTYSIFVNVSDGATAVVTTLFVTVNIPAPVALAPTLPSSGGGGGCTVGGSGNGDSSLPFVLLSVSLLFLRRKLARPSW